MKKSHVRSITWIFLLALSFSSYIYLKNIPVEQYEDYLTENSPVQKNNGDIEEKDNRVLLPDIALVNKIIDLSKFILHGK